MSLTILILVKMIIRIRIPMLPIARNTRNIEVVPTPDPIAVNLRDFQPDKRGQEGRRQKLAKRIKKKVSRASLTHCAPYQLPRLSEAV